MSSVQVRMQSSCSSQHASSVTNGGRTATNNFSVSKSASAAAAGNNADDVLKVTHWIEIIEKYL